MGPFFTALAISALVMREVWLWTPYSAPVNTAGLPLKRGDRFVSTPYPPPHAVHDDPMVRLVRTEKIDRPQYAALAELVHAPWPCERIRQAVAQFGVDTVRRHARSKGYTKKQIDEAMACLKEKLT